MKVREVEYSRLFNIGDFNNERITFRAEIEDGENPDEVLGKLFMKVLEVEEAFSKYREVLKGIEREQHNIEHYKLELRHSIQRLADLETRIIETQEKEDDYCRIKSLREELEREMKEKKVIIDHLRRSVREYNKLLDEAEKIAKAVSNGEFEKLVEERPHLDDDEIISKIEAMVSTQK